LQSLSYKGGFANDARQTTKDVFLYFYPIDPARRLHGFDNERVKIGVKREFWALGGAKLLKTMEVWRVSGLMGPLVRSQIRAA
jgi:hypothetical protein